MGTLYITRIPFGISLVKTIVRLIIYNYLKYKFNNIL